MMTKQSSNDVYSRTGQYFKVRALSNANATPIPADAKNMTQKRHTVYIIASPDPILAIPGEAISSTALLIETKKN